MISRNANVGIGLPPQGETEVVEQNIVAAFEEGVIDLAKSGALTGRIDQIQFTGGFGGLEFCFRQNDLVSQHPTAQPGTQTLEQVLQPTGTEEVLQFAFQGIEHAETFSAANDCIFFYFPFFMPPPLCPPPLMPGLPDLGDKNRLFFVLKGETVFFLATGLFGFFTSAGCSLGADSFLSSDIVV